MDTENKTNTLTYILVQKALHTWIPECNKGLFTLH